LEGTSNNPSILMCNPSWHFSAQAGNVFAFAPDVSQSKSASEDIIRLVDAKPEIDSEFSDGKTLENVTGGIELRDVHFRYPTRPTVRVLRGFNLTVEPGTHVALVGASGCGKSTVVQVGLRGIVDRALLIPEI
jgi:ATP-binding cassette, subfamily B (MDR/TAP), member 1